MSAVALQVQTARTALVLCVTVVGCHPIADPAHYSEMTMCWNNLGHVLFHVRSHSLQNGIQHKANNYALGYLYDKRNMRLNAKLMAYPTHLDKCYLSNRYSQRGTHAQLTQRPAI